MTRKLAFFVALLVLICSITGCSQIGYNAAIVQDGIVCRESWFENNLTKGSYQSEYDEELPESRTFLVENQEELDEIFSEFPKVDFEREMVLVYCYTTNFIRQQVLEQVAFENGIIKVAFDVARGIPGRADATAPQTRLCIVKLDKLNISTVIFTYNGQ